MRTEQEWQLWRYSEIVYTLEHANRVITVNNNLIARSIPAKNRETRKLVDIALEKLSSSSVQAWVRQRRIKQFVSAEYPLYELVVGRSTAWRMFALNHGGNLRLVIIDVFESHKGDGRRANDRALRCKDRYDAALWLADELFGGMR